MKPSTSSRAMPASASARQVAWWWSSKADLSSTRPQSDSAAPTIATFRAISDSPSRLACSLARWLAGSLARWLAGSLARWLAVPRPAPACASSLRTVPCRPTWHPFDRCRSDRTTSSCGRDLRRRHRRGAHWWRGGSSLQGHDQSRLGSDAASSGRDHRLVRSSGRRSGSRGPCFRSFCAPALRYSRRRLPPASSRSTSGSYGAAVLQPR